MSAVLPATSPACWTVLHVLFSSRVAGSERYCLDLAARQVALGHTVHLVSTPGAMMQRELPPGVVFHPMVFPLGRAWRLGRLMHRLGVDFCHAHLGPACKAVARSRGHRARTLATLHVGYKPHQHGRLHGVICVNQAQMAEAARHPGRVQVIPNWLPQTSPVAPGCALRAELGLRPEQLLVGCVGRLHTSKGQDLLVRAFLQAAPADAALVLVGEGPLLPDLELLAADDRRVHFVGYRHGISALLAEMDVFVSPSREESFGLAILEAMRAGLPILATAAPGPVELLVNQPAELVPVDDLPALTQALARTLAAGAPALRQPRSYALGRFERDGAVDRVMAFYAELLNPPERLAATAPAR